MVDVDTFPGSAWHYELMELALTSAGAFAGEEGRQVRALHSLFARAPERAQRAGLTLPDPGRVNSLIAAGAGACAILALFGGPAGYLVSRGGGGQYMASVVLPGAAEEVTASGDSLALALIGALALALGQADPAAGMLPEPYTTDRVTLN